MMNTFYIVKLNGCTISDDDVICDNAFDLIFQEIKKIRCMLFKIFYRRYWKLWS